MRTLLGLWIACGLVCLGCGKAVTSSPAIQPSSSDEAANEASTSESTDHAPTDRDFAFGPENAKIMFVGTHLGDDPKPRTGGFEIFSGTAKLDAEGKIASVTVDIQTDSLWTQHEKLTAHLNTPDFLDTREHPTARFESTKIEPAATEGEVTVTGNLTLHGVTKEISFPAKLGVTDGKPTLRAEFPLKRTEFGMDKMLEGVHDEVTMRIVIGEKTEKLPEAAP